MKFKVCLRLHKRGPVEHWFNTEAEDVHEAADKVLKENKIWFPFAELVSAHENTSDD